MSRLRFTNSLWRTGVLAACLFAMAQAVHAQTLALPEHWMEWDNHHAISGDGVGSCGITKQLSAEWDQSLQQIAATTASLGGPMSKYGYALPYGVIKSGSHRDLTSNSYQTCHRYPIEGSITFEIWTEDQVDLPPSGKGRAKVKTDTEGAGAIDVIFNKLTELPGYSIFTQARMGFYITTGTFQGYPVIGTSSYPNFAKRTILITAPGHGPAYVPVPMDSALKLLIPFQKEQVAFQEQKIKEAAEMVSDNSEVVQNLKKMGATTKQIQDYRQGMNEVNSMAETALKGARAQLDNYLALAKLSTAQRAGPVYVKPSTIPGVEFEILVNPEEGAQTLMMENPDYFNDELPRTAKQVMLIGLPQFDYDEVFTRGGDEKKLSRLWTYNFFKQVDWKAVAKSALR